MSDERISLHLSDPSHTADLAVGLASALEPGDTILLEGDVGAGKTHFARALIQSVLIEREDVPSPTFTLIQTYETSKGSLWHADLYRVTSVHEIEELGLADAFENSVCLVEWPDRLAELSPANALTLTLEYGSATDETPKLTASWSDPRWPEKLKRWV